jgi:thiamine biosynthesis protein ThiS
MIEVNGKAIEWEEGMTVENLLLKMNYTFPKIIIRVNGEIVAKELWGSFEIPDRADVHAHHLIAGG